jgi:hypothetical protein
MPLRVAMRGRDHLLTDSRHARGYENMSEAALSVSEASVARVHKLHLWWCRWRVEAGDKYGMFRTAKPLLHDGQHGRQITPHERPRIKP